MNKTTVINRIDYKPFSYIVYESLFICKNCDPKGEGGHGGLLARFDGKIELYSDIFNNRIKHSNFCPTCGKVIDWSDIKTRENWLK